MVYRKSAMTQQWLEHGLLLIVTHVSSLAGIVLLIVLPKCCHTIEMEYWPIIRGVGYCPVTLWICGTIRHSIQCLTSLVLML